MYSMKRKPATSATFIEHCKYQVVGIGDNMALPGNWRALARTFTTFATFDSARQAAETRYRYNDGKAFAVVDRDTAEVLIYVD